VDRAQSINAFEHGDVHITLMRIEPLKQALRDGGNDVIFVGARRDEETTRANERIVLLRSHSPSREPRSQRPELKRCFNWRWAPGATIRACPFSSSTGHDLRHWILWRGVGQAPLYLARERPVVMREGSRVVVDDPLRMRRLPCEQSRLEDVRFGTFGCWPATRANASSAGALVAFAQPTVGTLASDRTDRSGDGGSLERQ
jgi:sulfate adenylyltransferase subunit 2